MAFELPPTDYALRMRAYFIAFVALEGALVIGKFVISDFWGAISMLMIVLMGGLVLSGEYGLNVTNCLFYAVMAFISAVFEIMAAVMYFTHSKYGIFDSKAPTMVIVAQSIF